MKTCHAALTLLSMDKFLKPYYLHKNPWKDVYLTLFSDFNKESQLLDFFGNVGQALVNVYCVKTNSSFIGSISETNGR